MITTESTEHAEKIRKIAGFKISVFSVAIIFSSLNAHAEELKPPPKDPSKEYREQYYFHYDFYIDDAGEEGDTVKSMLKAGLAYEGDVGIIIDELIRSGSTAVDIGAHIGVHTITMSKKVGPHGKVLSFEPNKKLYCEQLYNLELNHCQNVTPIPKAAGSTVSRAFLEWGKLETAESSRGYYVDVVPLDSYQLDNVSLIKIDVENYEYFVLQGAQQTILRNKPILIFECFLNVDFAEIPKEAQKANFVRVASFLESAGYEIRVIHSCNFIAFPLDIGYPISLYRDKFLKLDLDTYNPNTFTPLGDGISYFRSWLP